MQFPISEKSDKDTINTPFILQNKPITLFENNLNMAKISVIIPIYNAEVYLENCLESIKNQSFTDYEVLLIDDGSTDNSGKICDVFATKDFRFQVIHKSNGGVSSARNIGIEQAKGEWICFMDSDDTVEKDYLQHLYQGANQQNDILVVQGFKTILPQKQSRVRTFGTHLYTTTDIYQLFQVLNINRSGYPFAKLYNSQIIQQHQIRFIEQIHYAEDVMFMLTYMCHINAIQTLDGYNYNYYIRNNSNSLSHRIFSFESEYTCYETYIDRINKLKNKFNIPEESLVKVYNVISEYLVRRSIGSMYQSQTYKPKYERIRILKSLTKQQIDFLNSYYKECSWFHKVTVFLLSNHYYYFCDRFNSLIALGRKLFKRNE